MSDEHLRNHWVGFDLGGTKMLAMVFDGEFRPLGRNRRKTRGHEGAKAGLERIAQTIEAALEESHLSRDQLAGIGVGCPGPLNLEKGIILEAPNLGWNDVPIRSFLEKHFGCPAVIANDVDSGVYGESRFGAGRNARTVVGIFPGTGIGGGCVYEGKIVRGATSSCMEIGHVQAIPGGPRCGCGLQGCLEAVSSRLAIAAAAAQAAYRGQAPHLRELAGTDLSKIRSSVIAESIKAGDKVIEQIVRDAAQHIGRVLGGVIHLVSPDCVVLGGGLVEAIPKIFLDEVESTARRHVLPSFAKTFKVVTAKLGDDAAAMGAAAWARESIRELPSRSLQTAER